MAGYSKLFSEIITSSIWSEDDKTRIVWITMLALKNSRGFVPAALPGLANAARVTTNECAAAIVKLEAPDQYSRTSEHGGRRIQKVDGGWTVLNHEKYREKRSDDERREYQRRWQEKHRKTANVDKMLTNVDINIDSVDTMLTHSDTDTDTDTDTDKKEEGVGGEPAAPGILNLCAQIQNCRPEFRTLNQIALENTLKATPLKDAQSAVNDFCRDMVNALSPPNMPLKLLSGYLRKAYDAAQPRKQRSRLT